ncbi:MAG TPA: undecaprenyl-diphosphate phosphatase [Bacteroidales bacterium]|nr:undecaprenyl-diphosphate phosphatase [Bacteroidales bacterium]
MTWLEGLLLGLLQGITEFLPVSSSGHIELGQALFGAHVSDDLMFSVVVHTASMLSIMVVFRQDLAFLIKQSLRFEWNPESRYVTMLLISMIPTGFAGLLFEKQIEVLFAGQILLVGFMLLVTAALLFSTRFVKKNDKDVSYRTALIIGIAQTIAIIPGISRSGATIGTALLLGIDKSKATRFSFLMVLLPIAGGSLIKAIDLFGNIEKYSGELLPMITGFVASFIAGWIACNWMLSIVRKGNIVYFSIYCIFIGLIAISFSVF